MSALIESDRLIERTIVQMKNTMNVCFQVICRRIKPTSRYSNNHRSTSHCNGLLFEGPKEKTTQNKSSFIFTAKRRSSTFCTKTGRRSSTVRILFRKTELNIILDFLGFSSTQNSRTVAELTEDMSLDHRLHLLVVDEHFYYAEERIQHHFQVNFTDRSNRSPKTINFE